MSNWRNFKPSGLFPEEIKKVGSGLVTVTDTIEKALKANKTFFEIAQKFVSGANLQGPEKALASTFNELLEFSNALADETTAHSIFIPIQKQPFGLGNEPPLDQVPSEDLTPAYDIFAEDNGIEQDASHDEYLVQFINNSRTAVGGNRGFWKSLRQSLNDEGDDARPEFKETFAVTGTVLLVGADNLSGINKNAQKIQKFFKKPKRADLLGKAEPVVKDVKTRIAPDPASGNMAVVVEWEPVSPVQNPSLYSAEALIVDELYIIRSTDSRLRESFEWKDVFNADPTDDPKPESDFAVLVERIPNDGLISKYFDYLESDEFGNYYYAVACRYRINDEPQPVGAISNVSKLRYDKTPVESRRSEAPDWIATPSLIDLVPDVKKFIQQGKLALEKLTARSTNNSGAQGIIKEHIAQLEKELARFQKLSKELSSVTNKINELLNEDSSGIYATTITVTEGGISAWMAELARCLSDPEDPSRPPFDGSELVCGSVFMAGAPNLPRLEAFKSLLELLFGSSDTSPTVEALNTLGTVVNTTPVAFDDGLNPISTSEKLFNTSGANTGSVFNEKLQPDPEGTC